MLYQSIKHRAEQKLSGHLPNSTKGRNLQYHNMSRDKNPQRESEMDSLSFESFHTQLDCKLMYSNKNSRSLPAQGVGRNTRLCLVFLHTLLLCSIHFLHALRKNRAQSRLLYLLIKQYIHFLYLMKLLAALVYGKH